MAGEFSTRTKIAALVQRVAARYPEFTQDVIKTILEQFPHVDSPKAKVPIEAQNARPWYLLFNEALYLSNIDSKVSGKSDPTPARPKTDTDILLESVKEVGISLQEEELSAEIIEAIKADFDSEEDAKLRKIARDKSALGAVLGDYLYEKACNQFTTFLESKDPIKEIDVLPLLMNPRDLVPGGRGPDFDRGPILIVQSFTVPIGNMKFKRDYTLNNQPATAFNEWVIKDLDSNLKIRSKVQRKDGAEVAFYAKAFWVQQDALLRGYLNAQESEDLVKYARHLKVSKGMLHEITEREYKQLGGK